MPHMDMPHMQQGCRASRATAAPPGRLVVALGSSTSMRLQAACSQQQQPTAHKSMLSIVAQCA